MQQNLFSKGILAIMLFFTRHLNALDIISAIFGLLSAMLMYTRRSNYPDIADTTTNMVDQVLMGDSESKIAPAHLTQHRIKWIVENSPFTIRFAFTSVVRIDFRIQWLYVVSL